MNDFKFLKGKSNINQRLTEIHERVIEAYNNRQINRDLYTEIPAGTAQPIKHAVMNAINVCNRYDHRYEDYEHHFNIGETPFKLLVLDIRRFRNPVYSYFIIRYKMGFVSTNLNDRTVINQLRIEPEEYYRLLEPTP